MKNFKNLCVRIICWVIRTVAPTWAIEKGILRLRKKRNGRCVDNKYAILLCPKVEKIVEYFHNHRGVETGLRRTKNGNDLLRLSDPLLLVCQSDAVYQRGIHSGPGAAVEYGRPYCYTDHL